MRIDKIKAMLTERYCVIISRASQIVNIATAAGEDGDVSRDITSGINVCINDISDVVTILEQLADALEDK